MVKRRTSRASTRKSEPNPEEVERFAAGADAATAEESPLSGRLRTRVKRLVSSASGVSNELAAELTELFIAELTQMALSGSSKDEIKEHVSTLEPSARRDFKSINLPLNRYEHELISALARRRGTSKSNVIRAAVRVATRER